MTIFYTNTTGSTVSSDEIAFEVIYRHAQRVLGNDDLPPVAAPALPPAIWEAFNG